MQRQISPRLECVATGALTECPQLRFAHAAFIMPEPLIPIAGRAMIVSIVENIARRRGIWRHVWFGIPEDLSFFQIDSILRAEETA
jgi:hypothetical protein